MENIIYEFVRMQQTNCGFRCVVRFDYFFLFAFFIPQSTHTHRIWATTNKTIRLCPSPCLPLAQLDTNCNLRRIWTFSLQSILCWISKKKIKYSKNEAKRKIRNNGNHCLKRQNVFSVHDFVCLSSENPIGAKVISHASYDVRLSRKNPNAAQHIWSENLGKKIFH